MMLHLIFEMFIGKYAPISSSALGIMGALAFAVPPIESRNLRTVLLQIEEIEHGISPDAFRSAKAALIRDARRLLKWERIWNLIGATLFVTAFLILFLNSIHCVTSNAC